MQLRMVIFCTGCNQTFGDNCSHPCPINCLDRQCYTSTGQCYGCVPGYQGQDCSQGLLLLDHLCIYHLPNKTRATFTEKWVSDFLIYVIKDKNYFDYLRRSILICIVHAFEHFIIFHRFFRFLLLERRHCTIMTV